MPMTVSPRAKTKTERTAIARTALRGAPDRLRPPSHAGRARSSAIAARRRLAATVLPTRFVNTDAKNVTAMTIRPPKPKQRPMVP